MNEFVMYESAGTIIGRRAFIVLKALEFISGKISAVHETIEEASGCISCTSQDLKQESFGNGPSTVEHILGG